MTDEHKEPHYLPDNWPVRALEIAREVLPGTNDDGRWWALWNATGYPAFFDGDAETVLRQQLEFYRDHPHEALAME